MLIFINNVFISEENIEYIELVIHDEKRLSNSYKVCTYEECVKYCTEKKSLGWNVFPLHSDTFKISKDSRITRIRDAREVNPSFFKEDSILSIYALYWDLASNNAILLDNEYKYENGYVGYLSEFLNMRIHNDSMKVTIPVIYNDKIVANRELISQKTNPYHNAFIAAIPKESISKFYIYGLKEVGNIVLNNKEFIVVSYRQNLSIYRCLSDFKFSEPVAVYYGNMSRKYEILTKLSKNALDNLGVNFSNVDLESPKDNLLASSLFNDSSGVYINHTKELPSDSLLLKVNEIINSVYLELQTNKPNVDTSKGIRNLIMHYDLPRELEYPMKILLHGYLSSRGNELSLIDNLISIYKDSRLKVLESDMYLYNLRTSCFVTPSALDYKKGQMMFQIYGPGEPMRMEVWENEYLK